jgi:hypothetical protein
MPLWMYTLENSNTSPLCILCMPMAQIIPLHTLTSIRTMYEESTPSPSPRPMSIIPPYFKTKHNHGLKNSMTHHSVRIYSGVGPLEPLLHMTHKVYQPRSFLRVLSI